MCFQTRLISVLVLLLIFSFTRFTYSKEHKAKMFGIAFPIVFFGLPYKQKIHSEGNLSTHIQNLDISSNFFFYGIEVECFVKLHFLVRLPRFSVFPKILNLITEVFFAL